MQVNKHIKSSSNFILINGLTFILFLAFQVPLNAKQISQPFGTVIGLAPGDVPVYSNEREHIRKDISSVVSHNNDGENWSGIPWQCVEFARRWLITQRDVTFPSIPNAYDIFDLTHVNRISDGVHLPIEAVLNGSTVLPTKGSMLIWENGYQEGITGHVAILVDILPYSQDSTSSEDKDAWENYDPGYYLVYIAEQNYDDKLWKLGQNYGRVLPAYRDTEGRFFIEENQFLGWINIAY